MVRRLRAQRFGAPSEPTFRRVLGALDPSAFDRRLGAWFAGLTPVAGEGIAIADKANEITSVEPLFRGVDIEALALDAVPPSGADDGQGARAARDA